jgi:hypothetical protein
MAADKFDRRVGAVDLVDTGHRDDPVVAVRSTLTV